MTDEIQPTMENLNDPYVLQLIEALSRQQDTIEEQAEWQNEREGAEHYGPFGANCMNTGQFDAGECWLCAGKRKQAERNEARAQLADAKKSLKEFAYEAKEANERYDAVWEQAGDYEELANANRNKAAEMQLVAGRYQYMHEQAQKALNNIDDFFEYAYQNVDYDLLRQEVRNHLAAYTKAVAKVPK